MKNYKELKQELNQVFGKGNVKWFNDKNKYIRRIKIIGKNKYEIHDYLKSQYPELVKTTIVMF